MRLILEQATKQAIRYLLKKEIITEGVNFRSVVNFNLKLIFYLEKCKF